MRRLLEVRSPVSLDTLHLDTPNTALWSRANYGEALPGVVTPMSWSFWALTAESATRHLFSDRLGALSRREASAPISAPEDAFSALYYGRLVVNVERISEAVGRLPGADPAAVEEQVLGFSRDGIERARSRRRYPVALSRIPVSISLLGRRIRNIRTQTDAWWRTSTSHPPEEIPALVALFQEATRRFLVISVEQGVAGMVNQTLHDRLAAVAEATGHAGFELRLNGVSGTEESRMVADIWRTAGGEQSIDRLLDQYGYHAPNEGELAARSWREDPKPLLRLLDQYRALSDPIVRERAEGERLVADFLSALPRGRRASTRALVRLCASTTRVRESGKVAFLQAIDVARAAARAAGGRLASAGALEDPDDVFYLGPEELLTLRPVHAREIVARRRERRAALRGFELPDHFVGVPDPKPVSEARSGGRVHGDRLIEGVAASAGRAEGTARVVLDPSQDFDFEPGDVLVCEYTDPGWAPLFELASAVVIDIGGPLSHGAIVARELGIPAVINTGDGTRRIPAGSRVVVDGDAGTVQCTALGHDD